MSAVVHVACDRCGDPVPHSRTLIKFESGPMLRQRRELDLCPACCEALAEWIRTPAARTEAGAAT